MVEYDTRGLRLGSRIKCHNWKDLKNYALALSAEGYGVAVYGFQDMSDNVLTITAEPWEEEDDDDEGRDCGV